MDLDKLKTIHIHPKYEIGRIRPQHRAIFKHHASAVLFMAIAASHKTSPWFHGDVLKVWRRWKNPKTRPKDAAQLEQLLWHVCKDPALQNPWRPAPPMPRAILTKDPETEAEYGVRIEETRVEWLRLMQELYDAMAGTRVCEIVILGNPEDN